MRTTVRLEDGLLREAKREASKRGETLTALIERGLRLALAGGRRLASRRGVKLPTSRATGGPRPGVDLNNSAALLDLLDRRR